MKLSRIRQGISLAQEVVKAADQANDNNGRTSRAELVGICDTEGYRGRHPMRIGALALHQQGRRAAGGQDPGARAIGRAGESVFQQIRQAAAKSGRADTLDASEFEALSASARRLVEFSKKYAGGTIDAYFF